MLSYSGHTFRGIWSTGVLQPQEGSVMCSMPCIRPGPKRFLRFRNVSGPKTEPKPRFGKAEVSEVSMIRRWHKKWRHMRHIQKSRALIHFGDLIYFYSFLFTHIHSGPIRPWRIRSDLTEGVTVAQLEQAPNLDALFHFISFNAFLTLGNWLMRRKSHFTSLVHFETHHGRPVRITSRLHSLDCFHQLFGNRWFGFALGLAACDSKLAAAECLLSLPKMGHVLNFRHLHKKLTSETCVGLLGGRACSEVKVDGVEVPALCHDTATQLQVNDANPGSFWRHAVGWQLLANFYWNFLEYLHVFHMSHVRFVVCGCRWPCVSTPAKQIVRLFMCTCCTIPAAKFREMCTFIYIHMVCIESAWSIRQFPAMHGLMVWVSLQSLQLRMEQISGLWLCETFLREVPQPKEICIWHLASIFCRCIVSIVEVWECAVLMFLHHVLAYIERNEKRWKATGSYKDVCLQRGPITTSYLNVEGLLKPANLRQQESRAEEWLTNVDYNYYNYVWVFAISVENWKLRRLTGLLLLHLDVPSHWLCLRILRVCLVSLSLHFHVACWRSFAMCGASTVPAVAARRSLFHLSIS